MLDCRSSDPGSSPGMAVCKTIGCVRKVKAKGYCITCYQREWLREKKRKPMYREHIAFLLKQWKQRNPDKVHKHHYDHYYSRKKDPILCEIDQHNWRARWILRSNHNIRYELWAEQGGLCSVCLCEICPGDWHLDHIVPRSRGGSDDRHNLRILCVSCNLHKGSKLDSEWLVS